MPQDMTTVFQKGIYRAHGEGQELPPASLQPLEILQLNLEARSGL